MSPTRIDLRIRDFDVPQSVDHMPSYQRPSEEGVGLFVTPNIQHLALVREDAQFAAAMASAQIIVTNELPCIWSRKSADCTCRDR